MQKDSEASFATYVNPSPCYYFTSFIKPMVETSNNTHKYITWKRKLQCWDSVENFQEKYKVEILESRVRLDTKL
jgi:hypothetical protein